MDVELIVETLNGIPHMRPYRGRELFDFVTQNHVTRILELGTAHGVSACYLAAAVDELGDGTVVTIDREGARNLEPSVGELVKSLNLDHLVTPIFAQRSFTWELMKILRDQPETRFDFVFLDGGHSWDVTGFAFYLVDALLRPGGWLLFDDLTWTYRRSASLSDVAESLPEDEADAEQVGLVFDLLVSKHPLYETWKDRNWGWARKVSATS